MSKAKISACLVIRNEEKVIRRCLDSIKDAVDEIIIVHDGKCDDKTLDICKEYTKKIFVRDYIGEAEPHRPFSFSMASGEWILWIDADEFFSEELKGAIRDMANAKYVNGYLVAYEIPYKNTVLKRIGLGKAYRMCLFRKGSFSMKGIIHETPSVNGKIVKVEYLLKHRPLYNPYSYKTFKRKEIKWAYKQAQQFISNDRASYPSFCYIFRGIFLFAFVVLKGIMHGSFLNGIAGLKISFLEGLYNYYVNWHIFVMKNEKSN